MPSCYLGRVISCPECKIEFIPGESNACYDSVEKAQEFLAPDFGDRINNFNLDGIIKIWNNITYAIRLKTCIAIAAILGLLIGVLIFQRSKHQEGIKQEQAEFREKYEEFIFEADQLESLTNYGINKSDFTRQLARVDAKWEIVPYSGFKNNSYSIFLNAMSNWESAIIYWDSQYLKDKVSEKLGNASESYKKARQVMKHYETN